MSLGLTDVKSILTQVMAWCRQAASHYLRQCWLRSMSQSMSPSWEKLWAGYCLTHWGRDKMAVILQTTLFKCIFLNENDRIAIKMSLTIVPKGPINNIPASVQIMAWRRPGNKPLSEPTMARLPMHVCITRPQWVNCLSDQKKLMC